MSHQQSLAQTQFPKRRTIPPSRRTGAPKEELGPERYREAVPNSRSLVGCSVWTLDPELGYCSPFVLLWTDLGRYRWFIPVGVEIAVCPGLSLATYRMLRGYEAVGACTGPRNCTISFPSPFVAIVIGPSSERSSGLRGALLGGQTRFLAPRAGAPSRRWGMPTEDSRIQY